MTPCSVVKESAIWYDDFVIALAIRDSLLQQASKAGPEAWQVEATSHRT